MIRCFARKLLFAVLLLAFLGNAGCTRYFFFPYKEFAGTPADLGYDYGDIYIDAADGTRLHGWLVPAKENPKGTVYFLHGNAENVSTHIRSVLWLVVQGYDVFALDYRGFGKSQGKPGMPEVFEDIDAGARWVIDYAAGRAGKKPIVFGQSIGGSLALYYLATNTRIREQFGGLISEGAFSSYDDIARHVLAGSWLTWPFRYPVSWLLPDKYDPFDAVTKLAPLPVMIVHSAEDEIIPFEQSQQLFERLSGPKAFLQADGPHIHAIRNPETRKAMISFIESLQEVGKSD